VEKFDDKFYTNNILRENLLPVANSYLLSKTNSEENNSEFPRVLKPIRGRGSQGVLVVKNKEELDTGINKLITAKIYGKKIMVEEYLPGKEITLTVMPPGNYKIKNKNVEKCDYWTLPVVERFGHEGGVTPYNGLVAVIQNSKLLSDKELEAYEIKDISQKCELAAKIIGAKAPIRIDCRKNRTGEYQLFDLNMKPNMTGPSRAHRKDQDSLTMISARGIGWCYPDLISNILTLHWKI
jgi:D-alanine-D-alanine ligase-like ATP-grasp enzyme